MSLTVVDGRARWGDIVPGLGVAALAVAVMTVPPVVAEWTSGGRVSVSGLAESVSIGFEQWMLSGTASPGSVLTDATVFWAVFHIAKALLAIALLCALIAVGRRIWSRAVQAQGRLARRTWVTVGVLGAWLPVLTLLVAVANVQGSIAPLSSVLSFLPIETTPAIEQVRAELATGAYGSVTTALVEDFRMYHVVLVGLLLVAITGVLATIVLMVIRRARLPEHHWMLRRVLSSGAVALTLLTAALGLLLLANLSTVADTATALAGFFNDGGS
ncbi:hypothetical protein [Microbacterium sp.]|uniref:hypothetical protein n=1 Tax=Microbacterium sp. TaxID=51671 RepID=UPI0039E67793